MSRKAIVVIVIQGAALCLIAILLQFAIQDNSRADNPAVAVEAEATGSIIGNAGIVPDSSASSGKSILFGDDNYGPQPATMPAGAVTPEQFGAKGDGVTDDTATVQRALDNGVGKTVWLSAKTYRIASKSLVVGNSTTLTGAGTGSVLKFTWFDGSQAATGKGPYIRNKNMNPGGTDTNITYSNFVIEGAGDGKPSGSSTMNPNKLTPSLRAGYIDKLTVTHLEIRNSPGLSLSYHSSRNVTITHNYVHNSGRDGITGFWEPGTGGASANITVTNNYVARVGDDGIALNGLPEDTYNIIGLPTTMTVAHNIVEGWPSDPNGKMLGRGIAIVGVRNVKIQYNSIINTSANSPGIMLVGCTNTFCKMGSYDPTTGQPWVSSDVTISNNTLYNAGRIPSISPGNIGSGIYVRTTKDSTVQGNLIVNTNPIYPNVLSQCTNCSVQTN